MKRKCMMAVIAAMMIMTGCGATSKTSENMETREEETTQTVCATQQEVNTEENQTTEESTTTAKVDMKNVGMLFGKHDKKEEENIASLIKEADEKTGFISYDAEDVEAMLQEYGIDVYELEKDILEENMKDEVLYHYTVQNEMDAEELEIGKDESAYVSIFEYDDEYFFEILGINTSSEYEEAATFCEEGTTIEYWAIGVEEDELNMLLPLFAGNEENGYYFVRTAWAALGEDVSDMMTLEEQGISFEADEEETGERVREAREEKMFLEITEVEINDGESIVYFELTNPYDFDVYFNDLEVSVNGVDVTEDVSAYITVEAGETVEDSLYINDCILAIGDEIIISAMVEDDDTFEQYGEISFVLELARK